MDLPEPHPLDPANNGHNLSADPSNPAFQINIPLFRKVQKTFDKIGLKKKKKIREKKEKKNVVVRCTVPPVARWLSQEEEEDEDAVPESNGGMQEPPATPVARDELALRRHRFFSDLLQAARSTAEHRVSFDPLGPMVLPG